MKNRVANIAQTGRDGNYLATLDGWRTISIALVLLAHGFDSLKPLLASAGILELINVTAVKSAGLLGVRTFFAISGFLITSRLIEEEINRGRTALGFFYLRRAFRILPASLCYLAVVALLGATGVLLIDPGDWLSAVFFFKNYWYASHSWYLGHFWSLAVEEHYYLIWPGCFVLLSLRSRRVLFLIILALAIALWRAVDFKYHLTWAEQGAGYFWGRTDIVVDGLLWGAVFAFFYARESFRAVFNKVVKAPLFILTLLFVPITYFMAWNWKVEFLLITLQAVLIPCLLIWTIENAQSHFGRMLSSYGFVLIGRLSYSIYLWQQLFLVYAASQVASLSLVQWFPLNFVLVFGAAFLSYHLVEKPCIFLGHRLAKRVVQKTPHVDPQGFKPLAENLQT